MTINEKEKFNSIVKEIFKCIKENDTNKIDELLSSIDNIQLFGGVENDYNFIKSYIDEAKGYCYIQDEDVKKYLNLGNLSLFYEDFYTAYQYFEAGTYYTKNPIFQYYIGVCFYFLGRYGEAMSKFENYLIKNNFKAEEAYYFLKNICERMLADEYTENGETRRYYGLISKLENYDTMHQKIKNLKNGQVFKITKQKIKKQKNINLNDAEILELISKGKINDVAEIFENAKHGRKISILAILYRSGFATTADKLLKINRDDLKENCPEQLSLLNKNKQLYLNQAKFKRG